MGAGAGPGVGEMVSRPVPRVNQRKVKGWVQKQVMVGFRSGSMGGSWSKFTGGPWGGSTSLRRRPQPQTPTLDPPLLTCYGHQPNGDTSTDWATSGAPRDMHRCALLSPSMTRRPYYRPPLTWSLRRCLPLAPGATSSTHARRRRPTRACCSTGSDPAAGATGRREKSAPKIILLQLLGKS